MKRFLNNIEMNEELTKIWVVNWSAIYLSFQDIDNVLRILLLVVSIIYTGFRLWRMMKNDKTNE